VEARSGQTRFETGYALMFGPGTRLKAAPKEESSLTFSSDPLGWMVV